MLEVAARPASSSCPSAGAAGGAAVGGVGLTPLLSMLEEIAARHPGLETHWVHGALDGAARPSARGCAELAGGMPALRATTFLEPRRAAGGRRPGRRRGWSTAGLAAARNTPLGGRPTTTCAARSPSCAPGRRPGRRRRAGRAHPLRVLRPGRRVAGRRRRRAREGGRGDRSCRPGGRPATPAPP